MKTNLVSILFVLVTTFILTGYGNDEKIQAEDQNHPNNSTHSDYFNDEKNVEPEENIAIAYGNGIYYFHWTGAAFGNALSRFKKRNPNLEETAIAGEVTRVQRGREVPKNHDRYIASDYGATVGYWVTFREKK